MRASPAIHVSLNRFGLWRAAVWSLALAATAAILVWLFDRDPPAAAALQFAAATGLCAAFWLAVGLARVRPVGLRWDGQVWHLSRAHGPAAEPVAGDVVLAIDLGVWMLLRFEPAARVAGIRRVWLPVQRVGLEAEWHALRCAVYSPRPGPGAQGSPP